MEYKNILRFINAEMATRKITQLEMAHSTGIDPSNISRFLNGRRKMSYDTLEKCLNVLGYEIQIKEGKNG